MKTIRYTISTFLFAFSSLAAHSEGNPAAIYCEHMGYQYEVETDENGGEKGICILPDGSKVNAWDFYLGKIKPEYSYCKKNGYDIVPEIDTIGSYYTEKAYCVKGTTLRSSNSDTEKIPMVELMKKNGIRLYKSNKEDIYMQENKKEEYLPNINVRSSESDSPNSDNGSSMSSSTGTSGSISSSTSTAIDLPETYDAREFGVVNPPRNQSSLGTCWAFASAACTEIGFNIAGHFTEGKSKSVSESYIIYCIGGDPDRSINLYYANCNPYDSISDYGFIQRSMSALHSQGSCLLPYFQYQQNPPQECVHWNDPKIIAPEYHILSEEEFSKDFIKQSIIQSGCIGVNLVVKDNFKHYKGDIYDLTTDKSDTIGYHSVCLIGWGIENGEEYWILRNSWGTDWGEFGYMKMKIHDNCNNDFTYGIKFIPDEYVYQYETINADYIVPESSFGKSLTLKGEKVLLKPGFKAEMNSGFKAVADEIHVKESTNVQLPCADENDYWKDFDNQTLYGSGSAQTLTGIEENSEDAKSVTLYPNPSSGTFSMDFGNIIGEKNVSIVDLNGNLVYRIVTDDDMIDVTISDINAGVYLVRIVTENDSMTKRLIIK